MPVKQLEGFSVSGLANVLLVMISRMLSTADRRIIVGSCYDFYGVVCVLEQSDFG
ncbi:hypothetical protein CJA_3111 [Cellvibrio japonicus Ueda107]|uniref:Uncharacterized protein n=1 Tax=Cellvibrio japonicus (strain Ueda107) TaxID=498211 RepID=B3PDF3_CELJU|nr:hypothetical protein CJA_3111 [Cellvibrio japonicus Ueda107]